MVDSLGIIVKKEQQNSQNTTIQFIHTENGEKMERGWENKIEERKWKYQYTNTNKIHYIHSIEVK